MMSGSASSENCTAKISGSCVMTGRRGVTASCTKRRRRYSGGEQDDVRLDLDHRAARRRFGRHPARVTQPTCVADQPQRDRPRPARATSRFAPGTAAPAPARPRNAQRAGRGQPYTRKMTRLGSSRRKSVGSLVTTGVCCSRAVSATDESTTSCVPDAAQSSPTARARWPSSTTICVPRALRIRASRTWRALRHACATTPAGTNADPPEATTRSRRARKRSSPRSTAMSAPVSRVTLTRWVSGRQPVRNRPRRRPPQKVGLVRGPGLRGHRRASPRVRVERELVRRTPRHWPSVPR